MAQRVILHIGTMKSGTSFLQALLFSQQQHLAAHGVLVPGKDWGDQVRAVRTVLRGEQKPWQDMARQVAAHDGTAVISMEFLGPAKRKNAERVLAPYRRSDVQIVVTARDLNRTLVSMWQETVQNGRAWTWQEYYEGARDTAPGTGRGDQDRTTAAGTFWRQQNLARILADWSDLVGVSNTTLVTLPPPGAANGELTERFAAATGLPIDLERPVPRANESIGLASALVLREMNAALAERGFGGAAGQGLRKGQIAKNTLAALARDEPRLGLSVADWVVEQTEATRRRVTELGVPVVGPLSDLDPVEVPGIAIEDVDPELRARAATAALTEAVAQHPSVGEAKA